MTKDEGSTIVPGTVLWGTYRAVRVIGVGGMGVVVHAKGIASGGDVAIKFLLPQFAASKEAATRFVREARAVTRIRSKHVAGVMDVGTSDEHGPFIVMEYLAGSDLSRRVRTTVKQGKQIPIDVAIDYISQAGDALAHAHAEGVVHRDVKPANLFLAEQPDQTLIVKVLDFGISKLADDAELGVTKTTTVLGSGLYMSPEQMRSAKGVDHRTDIYGLGISLYELLTGTQPFTAETYPDLCIKVAMDPPDPIRRFRPDVPEELAAVIARAYARKAEDRYASIAAFMTALAPWANAATRARITAIAGAGKPHLRLESSPSIPPPDAPRERSADMWRDALGAASVPADAALDAPKPIAQHSIPSGLSKTSSTSATGHERDGSTRTIVFSAVGTFVVLAATVAIYVFAIRPRGEPTGSSTATASAERQTVAAATSTTEHPPVVATPSATPDSTQAAPAASEPATAGASAAPSATPASTPTTTGWTAPRPSATPSPTPTPAPSPTPAPTPTAPPGDPFACVNPVTHLREACH